jgi:two-component system, OmpR family, sensor kinase
MLIRTRLALALMVILAIALTTFSFVIYEVMRSSLVSEMQRDVRQRANTIAIATAPAHGSTTLRLPRLDVFNAQDAYVQIRSPSGGILATSSNLGNLWLPLPRNDARAGTVQEVRVRGVPLIMSGRKIMVGGKERAYVLVAQTPSTIYLALNRLRQFLFPGTALALLLAGLAVWFLVWRSLQRLERLDATAADIAASRDHTRRVQPERRNDEIGRLTRSINSMLGALDDAYRQAQSVSELQRQFLADVSHELRRPLTIMLSSLDLMGKIGAEDPAFQIQTLADMRIEVDRMARMVTQLLILARTDSSATMPREPVLLADVIADACRQGQPMNGHASLTCQGIDRLEGVVVQGNVDYLQQLFLILLDNAFKYTGADGKVEVTASPNGGTVDVIVADTGPGIPPDDLEHIFDRFFRASNSRHIPGMGLGLSIAHHIVEQHQGDIQVVSAPGTGSRFTVKLPVLALD